MHTPKQGAPGQGARSRGRPTYRVGRVEVVGAGHVGATVPPDPRTDRARPDVGRARGRPNGLLRVTNDTPDPRHAHPPARRPGGGRHRAYRARRRGMTALTVTLALVLLGAAAIVQFRTVGVTTESAGGSATQEWSVQPPGQSIGRGEVPTDGTSFDGGAAPFQIRPAAVMVDSHQVDPLQADSPADRLTAPDPVVPAPASGAGTPATDGPAAPASASPGDQPAPQATAEPIQPPGQAPTAENHDPAPVVVAGTLPPPVPATHPAVPPAAPPTTAPPASPPTTAPPASPPTTAPTAPPTPPDVPPTRGKSADHLPDHANGGVGNTNRPAPPSNPGVGPSG